MKRIMVTGSNGLLGQKITDLSLIDSEIELIATSVGLNRHPVKSGYTYEELDVLDAIRLDELVARIFYVKEIYGKLKSGMMRFSLKLELRNIYFELQDRKMFQTIKKYNRYLKS
jgi:hypothetical protein